MRKKILSLILALAAMIASLTACKEEQTDIPHTLDEILTSYGDNTNLDEIMELSEKIQIVESGEEKRETTISESIVELEEKMALADKITGLKIAPSNSVPEETKEIFENMSKEDIEAAIESLSGDLTDIQRERIKAGLSYINAQCQDWIMANGLQIIEEASLLTIKAAACEVSGLENEYYESCTVSHMNPVGSEPTYIGTVCIKDPISGATLNYEMSYDDGAIIDVATILYKVQSLDETATYNTIRDYCDEGLDAIKVAVAAGATLDDGNLTSESSAKDAKKLILEMQE